MAKINSKLIKYATQAQFDIDIIKVPAIIDSKSIVFVEDTGRIYAHGKYFGGAWEDISSKPETFAPAAHKHGSITNDGKIGTQTNRIIETTTGGLLTHVAKNTAYNKAFGTGSDQVARGNHTHDYLPLTGGTITGASYNMLTLARSNVNGSSILFKNSAGNLGKLGFASNGVFHLGNGASTDGVGNLLQITSTGVAQFYGNISTSGLVTGTGFSKTGATDAHMLLGSGGHKAISDFVPKAWTGAGDGAEIWMKSDVTTAGHSLGLHFTNSTNSTTATYQSRIQSRRGSGNYSDLIFAIRDTDIMLEILGQDRRVNILNQLTVQNNEVYHSGNIPTWNQSTTGNAATASAVSTSAENTGTTSRYILFADKASGNQALKTNTGLKYVPSTNTISATFSGDLTGNVTGNVSGSAGSATDWAGNTYTNSNITNEVYLMTSTNGTVWRRTLASQYEPSDSTIIKTRLPRGVDANTISQNGIYGYANNVSNTPAGDYATILHFQDYYKVQLAVNHNASGVYIRGGTTSDWNKIWHSGNLANGTTSQYIRGDGSLATYSDTTYTTGTLAQLNAGTDTIGRLQTAKNLHEWLSGKNYATVSDVQSEIPLVIGTQTATTASWTGAAPFATLTSGTTIRYWLPRTSASGVTLNLTLKGGGTTGAINCYVRGTTRLNTHYPAGSYINMTYLEGALINGTSYTGWWAQTYYADGTESYTVRWNTPVRAGSEITRYKIVMQGSDGGYHPITIGNTTAATKTVSTVPFLIGSPILWYFTTATVASGALTSTSYNYTAYTTSTTTYTFNQSSGFRAGEDVYLKGTVNGAFFTLDNTTLTSHLTQDLPTVDDGFYYMRLGVSSNTTTGFRLTNQHPIYYFQGGELQSLNTSHGADWNELLNKPTTFTALGLTDNAGSATQPVYFSGGKPVAATAYASASVNYATSAGTATNATNATNTTNIDTLADNSSNAARFILFSDAAEGNQRAKTDTGLKYNPSSNTITATLAGNASSATNCSRSVVAGNGLTGGGALTANRTLTLGTPTDITLSSTNSVDTSSHTHAFTPGGTTSQYIRGDGSLATYANTTYSTGTLAQLKAGTDTTGRLQTAKLLNEWLTEKGYITSYVDTTYTAGANVQISGTNVISATNTNTTYSAGNGISLSSTTFSVAGGNGLVQETSGLKLATPSTITSSTTNSVGTTTHTHALTITKADILDLGISEVGPQGPRGYTGDKPSHQWSGTSLRFENPNGTWPSGYVNLKGDPGSNGSNGSNGFTWRPAVSTAGLLTWTQNSSTTTPTQRDIKGPKGDPGAPGAPGSNGTNGFTWRPAVNAAGDLTWTRNSSTTTPADRNIKGPKGDTGAPGLTTSIKVNGSTYTQSSGVITLPFQVVTAMPASPTAGVFYFVKE